MTLTVLARSSALGQISDSEFLDDIGKGNFFNIDCPTFMLSTDLHLHDKLPPNILHHGQLVYH